MIATQEYISNLIEKHFGSFSKLRHQINNRINWEVQYNGKRGMDRGVLLDEVVKTFSYKICNPNCTDRIAIQQYIHYNFHN